MTQPVTTLRFAVRAPSKEVFIQSWVDAGIWALDIESGQYVYSPEYPGITTNMETWPGIIVKTPATYKADGSILKEAVLVEGWHTNVVVVGPLVQEMTFGLEQYEADGETLKSIFDRTWAVQIFSLTYNPKHVASKFPDGYANLTGIHYADTASLNSPSNIILI